MDALSTKNIDISSLWHSTDRRLRYLRRKKIKKEPQNISDIFPTFMKTNKYKLKLLISNVSFLFNVKYWFLQAIFFF